MDDVKHLVPFARSAFGQVAQTGRCDWSCDLCLDAVCSRGDLLIFKQTLLHAGTEPLGKEKFAPGIKPKASIQITRKVSSSTATGLGPGIPMGVSQNRDSFFMALGSGNERTTWRGLHS